MDAVELPLPPVDVAAAPKLMGSEGFGRAGVQVKDEDPRQPRPRSSSIEYCSSRLLETDVTSIKTDTEFPSLIKGEELTKNLPDVIAKNCTVDTPRLQGAPFQRKSAKASRSNGSCSKKPRMSQPEDSTSLNGIEESKDISDKPGSHNINCTSPEKSQLPKQKSNASKRGDKRNFKVPSAKSKYDSSSMKMGASIFSSSCGGNNFFGLYGLKHDFQDVTTLVDEPPLDELLKGTFNQLISSKDKGKKVSNMNENFISSVRKAFSVLQFPHPDQSRNMAEMDCSPNKKMSNFQLSSACAVEGSFNGDNEQSCTTDMSSCQKDPCSETETRASPLDFPLCQPKDVFERLALNPSRDLESLLLDVSKPAVTTKSSNDLRSGKQVLRRPSLPAFPWSHAFGGHSRSNSDTVKLSTSRSTCQGKWTRIGVIASSTDIDRSCFTNLDSFNYDQSLVPSTGSSDNKLFASLFANLPTCQRDSSSTVTCSKDSQVNAESGVRVDTKQIEEHCPKVLAAARILCDMATHAPRHNPDGILRWQRKTSHKAVKTFNFKSSEKPEGVPSTPISISGSDLVGRSVEQTIPSKKPRLTVFDSKNSGHSTNVKKGTYVWPTSKSSRSSLPNKPVRDTILENKRSTTTSTLKQHCMMPPPPRDLDKAYGGQQQVGKLVLMDWKRGRDKSD